MTRHRPAWFPSALVTALLLGGPALAAAQDAKPRPDAEGRTRVPPRSEPAPAPAAPAPAASAPAAPNVPVVAAPRTSGTSSQRSGTSDTSRRRTPVADRDGGPTRAEANAEDQANRAQPRRSPPPPPSAGRPPASGAPADSAGRRRYPTDGRYGGGVAVPRPPHNYPGGGWWDHRYYGSYRPSYWYWAPWGWGLGSWVYYDPWWGSYGSAPYGYGYGGSYYDEGSVRLKVKPREAEVYVDGYYVGIVDEFDGSFQRLRLNEGPHHIEVRLGGFAPLEFKVYVVPDRTLTLRGVLQPMP